MSRSLKPLFDDLCANKQQYINSAEGGQFEDRLDAKLHNLGYSRIVRNDIEQEGFKLLKEHITGKETLDDVVNPFAGTFKSQFMRQPYGSQAYPDFAILKGDRVISIEVKFSKGTQSRPVWNSGLPRPNGVYIFGSLGREDITFFRGCDVLSLDEVKKLQDFFDKGLKVYQREFNSDEMSKQKYGFSAYIRKAFEQSMKFNELAITNYFSNPCRAELEQSVIDYVHP